MLDLIWLVPVLPLIGAALNILLGRKLGEPRSGWLASISVAISFFLTVAIFFTTLGLSAEERSHTQSLFTWIGVGNLRIDLAFLADPLSIVMALFVTGISTLIHIYAIGYMHEDRKFSKFFIYLNLFVSSMLVLVLGENLAVTFLGWEGVGACSYLLISFWQTKNSAAIAGKKAFVTNRIGDFGVMIAMFIAFSSIGSISYLKMNEAALTNGIASVTATAISLLLFLGACGKSAQLPLYIWLPDAMEGPTPVSALIHAATMVTSGVFLMARMNPMLHISFPMAPTTIAVVGGVTALFAATIAVAQNDIKKVLAYSTISQLGFMFLAIGSGAYVAAIFHMVTHAFFKALLFLGAGSVIHGMHHEQDLRKMGALRRAMPITGFTFIVGWLAIAGVPPFAGFWSKDELLLYVLADNPPLYFVGLVTAVLTAFYMTRQVIMVFFGTAKWNDNAVASREGHSPHESPKIMIIPLMVLAILSVFGGALQLPFGAKFNILERWLEPVVEHAEANIHGSWGYQHKYVLLAVATIVAIGGIFAAIQIYGRSVGKPFEPNVLEQAWHYDALVGRAVGGAGARTFGLISWIDANVVDAIVNGVGESIRFFAQILRRLQTGYVRAYAVLVGLGAVVVLVWFLARGMMP